MTLHPPSPSTFREFRRMFPDEAACIDYLARWRWPDGFRCPRCGGEAADRLRCRPLWECRACRLQTSVTAGTALHRSHLPLSTWLYAIWLLAVRKVSTSALQLQREAGIGSYGSAWALLHKVRLLLSERGDAWPLRGDAVEVDETKVFGRGRESGRIGRRLAPGSAWIVAAVERFERSRGNRRWQASGSARVARIPDTTGATLCDFVQNSVEPGALVVTDGWGAYADLSKRGFRREATVLHKNNHLAATVQPKVHLFFSNLKALLVGTYHGISVRYLDRYLAEYAYRFNRRHHKAAVFGYVARRLMRAPWTSIPGLRPEATG
jgi:hypothetical protein